MTHSNEPIKSAKKNSIYKKHYRWKLDQHKHAPLKIKEMAVTAKISTWPRGEEVGAAVTADRVR